MTDYGQFCPVAKASELLGERWVLLILRELLLGTYLGLFEMGITFAVWLHALKLARDTTQVGILIYICPFLSLVFLHLFAHESLRPTTLPGLALIVAGIVLQRRWAADSDSSRLEA